MPSLELEDNYRASGYHRIAGVDEAGRGPLAGPVVAAAVILPLKYQCPFLDDSKKLSPSRRESLYQEITRNPQISWASASVEPSEIDRINILQATYLAMRAAVHKLPVSPDGVLIDGKPVPGFPYPHQAVVKGDSISLSIAAASIIAKVERDHLMGRAAQEFPGYGFERHKGYGTRIHLEALQRLGPCPLHRLSFAPVAASAAEAERTEPSIGGFAAPPDPMIPGAPRRHARPGA